MGKTADEARYLNSVSPILSLRAGDITWTFDEEVSQATDAAHRAGMRGEMTGEAFLYYRPGRGARAGALLVAADRPAEFALADTRSVPYRSMTREQLRMWIYDRARRLPILPV